ncbi:MAG: bifunctional folylpolyglutamate synthase/dihydrofolate synthase [Lachnospiraceae bacterium]|nr:bifunctional folylpolyglutamate synthase/dihydrofolate synthase [Lachnospiraceae bacterium]
MTYNECVDYILSIPKFADKLGIDNLNCILDIMDHPERKYPVIHVAGTNGKGSTSLFLASILKEKGERVGIFTSPHLIRLNERIRINDDVISDEDFVGVFEKVMKYIDKASKRGIAHPSFFEFVFLMSAVYFADNLIDYAIFETGMGGRLDATNVVRPKLCIITSVGMDHMQYLGNTIEEIAYEKAGIIKKGVPVVFFDRKDAATGVIADYCKEIGENLHIVEKKQYNLLKITKKTIDFSFESVYYRYDSLRIKKTALYQIENAVLAVRAFELLSEMDYNINNNVDEVHIDLKAIRNGLYNMTWAGRMQRIDERIFVDGAHNEEAIKAFCHTLEVLYKEEPKILLFAVSKDKDYENMIEHLGRISFDEIVLVKYNGERSAELDKVKEAFRHFLGSKITTFEDIETGFEYVKTHVEDRLVFCVGSLYLVGDLLKIQEYRND